MSSNTSTKKNVQVIDGALNAWFPIYEIEAQVFAQMFPSGHNVAFGDEVAERLGEKMWSSIWHSPIVDRSRVVGIHGTLFCGLEERRPYFPTRRIEEPSNGSS